MSDFVIKAMTKPAIAALAIFLGVTAAPFRALAQEPIHPSILSDSVKGAPQPVHEADDAGTISGTVLDVNGDIVPGVTVAIDGPSPLDHREQPANENAAFQFNALRPGIAYHLSINAKGFAGWTSSSILLEPGQYLFLTDVRLQIAAEETSVTVYASTEQIAAQQVRLEEQQRVLGFIPNFYVVYDSKNAVPLTPKLKFNLAMRVSRDPVTIGAVGFMAGINQWANRPDYQLGAKGYGQRFGAEAANGFSDILIGGAILPIVLHQDPRYFYQGTGTTRSRLNHAMLSPFICKGDNGHNQFNLSSVGGDLSASALLMTYYPESNRSGGMVFGTFAIGTAERVISTIAQEFIIPHFMPKRN